MKNDFIIAYFRHGQSLYWQGNKECEIEGANDLSIGLSFFPSDFEKEWARQAAIWQVRQSARDLGKSLNRMFPVTIFSSPTGRTLHTAKIICEELIETGFSVLALYPCAELSEVKNFDWPLFKPLVNGGMMEFYNNNQTVWFFIDKTKTNPNNLVYQDYFMQDLAHCLPEETTEKWPISYLNRLNLFERFSEVKKRCLLFIKHIIKNYGTGNFIIVGHEAMAMYLVSKFANGQDHRLGPAQFLLIERKNGGLAVVQKNNVVKIN